jgi:hypothetical protein
MKFVLNDRNFSDYSYLLFMMKGYIQKRLEATRCHMCPHASLAMWKQANDYTLCGWGCTYMNTLFIYYAHLLVFYCGNSTSITMPIRVAARSEAWTVFARSNTAVLGSIPTRGMDVCVRLVCVCAVPCVGSGLATG